MSKEFELIEATVAGVHAAYAAGNLTARQLTQRYLDRIEALDKGGPALNSIVAVNPMALAEADRLDVMRKGGSTMGPLHGIPVIIKDQAVWPYITK